MVINMEEQHTTVYCECRICGSRAEHTLYHVKEMYFGTRKEFAYFECEKCQCLQIMEIPENLEEFYTQEYYSFQRPEMRIPLTAHRMEAKVLDVGCGAGEWLMEQYAQGYVNLFGCDFFIDEDIIYEPCIDIKKCTIHEIKGSFDFIRLKDSFEHMGDPYEVLVSIERLLNENGVCLISMPVFPNAAYDVFKENWYEWDAPRHLFIHSEKSMDYLCRKAGLKIKGIEYNSGDLQFITSLLYQEGIPYVEQNSDVIKKYFSPEELAKILELTNGLNQNGYGDHAVFTIGK